MRITNNPLQLRKGIPMARFIVVKTSSEGGLDIHPMKEWLRLHTDSIPANMDPTLSTSRQLLSGLKRNGWKFEETDSEVRLFPPGEAVDEVLVKAVLGESDEPNDSEGNQAFGLEVQLRDFLAGNIESLVINGNRLHLYVDPTGQDGVEFPTAVGFIDVLGIDDDGNFYVFELKRDVGSDRVVGQIARYMGWVQSTIGKKKKMHGIIVAKQIGKKLRYAASIIPSVSLYEYQVDFQLNESNDILS